MRATNTTLKLLAFAILLASAPSLAADNSAALAYPLQLSDYPSASENLFDTILARAKFEPFNIFAAAIFLFAILHTFCHRLFLRAGEKIEKSDAKGDNGEIPAGAKFLSRLFHLAGEVEIIFALWLIPLFAGFWIYFGWDSLTAYVDWLTFEKKKFIEPVFVVFVMCVSATRPIIQFSEDVISVFAKLFAKLGGGELRGWWMAILCVGSLLGSFITEPAAITICAVLLAKKFYAWEPGENFKYATLGLLLAAVSAGGTLTHFSAPPVLMVAGAWDWDSAFMFWNFGLKSGIAIFAGALIVMFMFGKEFSLLKLKAADAPQTVQKRPRAPKILVAAHLAFLGGIVATLHHPTLMIFIFLAFAAFVEMTQEYQYKITFKAQLLVGLFLAALVAHGSLQGWWIEPTLTSLGQKELFFGSLALTAFNDNAAITYLATLVPNFDDSMKYMVVAGAIAGGGLTVIANAPNPAGISILSKYFKGGVSPVKLILWAAIPTAVLCAAYLL